MSRLSLFALHLALAKNSRLFCAQGFLMGTTGAIKSPSGMRSVRLTHAVCHNPEVCILFGTYLAHGCHQSRLEFPVLPYSSG